MAKITQWRAVSMLCVMVCVMVLVPATLAAQEPAEAPVVGVSFDSVQACQDLATAMKAVAAKAEELDAVLPQKVESREALASTIFQGTQIVLAFGEQMFTATDAHEEKCKAALRDGGKPQEIARIYELVVEPTVRAHSFFVWVRDSADSLQDAQTVKEMNEAIEGYRAASFSLVDFCEKDLPDELGTAPCGELRKRLDEQMKGE